MLLILQGHVCDICGKAFRQKSQMKLHQLRHEINAPSSVARVQSHILAKVSNVYANMHKMSTQADKETKVSQLVD